MENKPFLVELKCPHCGTTLTQLYGQSDLNESRCHDGVVFLQGEKIVTCQDPDCGYKGCGERFVVKISIKPQIEAIYKLVEVE